MIGRTLLFLSAAAVCVFSEPGFAQETTIAGQDIRVIFKTDKGDLHATIFTSKAPVTAANFLNLVKRNFYDGAPFHAKDPKYFLHGGDPTGTGRGATGYYVENETSDDLLHDRPGILSMSRKKAIDTNSCQFFFTLAPAPHLDGLYSIFGKVTKGAEDVLPSLEVGDKILDVEILDSPDSLFEEQKARLKKWNRILDQREKLQAAE